MFFTFQYTFLSSTSPSLHLLCTSIHPSICSSIRPSIHEVSYQWACPPVRAPSIQALLTRWECTCARNRSFFVVVFVCVSLCLTKTAQVFGCWMKSSAFLCFLLSFVKVCWWIHLVEKMAVVTCVSGNPCIDVVASPWLSLGDKRWQGGGQNW